ILPIGAVPHILGGKTLLRSTSGPVATPRPRSTATSPFRSRKPRTERSADSAERFIMWTRKPETHAHHADFAFVVDPSLSRRWGSCPVRSGDLVQTGSSYLRIADHSPRHGRAFPCSVLALARRAPRRSPERLPSPGCNLGCASRLRQARRLGQRTR